LRKAQGHPGISEAPGRNTYNGPKNSKKVHIGTFVPSMKVVVKRINILANICNHTIHLALQLQQMICMKHFYKKEKEIPEIDLVMYYWNLRQGVAWHILLIIFISHLY
jgi:hypothetical protein